MEYAEIDVDAVPGRTRAHGPSERGASPDAVAPLGPHVAETRDRATDRAGDEQLGDRRESDDCYDRGCPAICASSTSPRAARWRRGWPRPCPPPLPRYNFGTTPFATPRPLGAHRARALGTYIKSGLCKCTRKCANAFQRMVQTPSAGSLMGVTVVTGRNHDGTPHGATVNAFTAVSLESALCQVTPNCRSRRVATWRRTVRDQRPRDQLDTAWHFAGRPADPAPKWARVPQRPCSSVGRGIAPPVAHL